jgi:hypothetical protein
MTEENKNIQADEQISDEQLADVSGGNSVHKTRLEHLDNQSKSVKDIQAARLEHLDNQSK